MAGHTTGVSAPPAETLAEALRPLTEAPERAAILLDVDGTLAPIVERAADARVPDETARLLEALADRYAGVACVSGRAAADARRLVGIDRLTYAGSHGAELLEPGDAEATILPAFADWAERVSEFTSERADSGLRALGIRSEDKGPIVALHWRGAPDEDEAQARLAAVAHQAEDEGLATHWGRKVLEIRPPVRVDKGRAVEEVVRRLDARAALFAGDDTTDLDAFAALDRLDLDASVRVGIASDEGPPEIVERADVVVDGPEGFVAVLEVLASA
jgi:trehalose 6-phosphate phosphatase